MARIAVVFTGGTISTAFDPVAGGNVPTLDGSAILARTPGLDAIADVVAIDLGRTPASHFTFPTLLGIADTLRSSLADPAIDGAVVVQGTDTIEETSFCWDLLLEGPKPVVVTGAMRASDALGFDGPANLRDAVRVAASEQMREAGVVVCLAGTIEPADDVVKMHASALDTFASPNGGSLGRVEEGEVRVGRQRGGRRHIATSQAAERVHLIVATVAMDSRLLEAAVAVGADGIVVAATGAGNTDPALLAAAARAMEAGIPVALATRCPAGRAGTAYAFPGGGAMWVRAGALPVGHLCAVKARVALALGIGAGLDHDGLAALLADPGDAVPLDLLITGRIATLAGASGFGWVEAIGIRDGRVAFAGSEVALETRADPFTERIVLEPYEVAIPGLTDAHLHLAATALAMRDIDLSGAASLSDGLVLLGTAHRRTSDPEAWLLGHGWDLDRWGRWPTADDLEAVAPGRRFALWAHDHHSLWVSRATLTTVGIDGSVPDPEGGVVRRTSDGEPEGVLLEEAAALVAEFVPRPTVEELERAIVAVSHELLSLGLVGVHDPCDPLGDPELRWSYPAYATLAERGALPIRLIASHGVEALETALAGGLRSGDILGANPQGRARVGWVKVFADGTLGSRTAALLADMEAEPDRPLAPELRRGLWATPAAEMRSLVDRAAAGGIAAQVHAIGDAAVRVALDVLTPTAGRTAFMPRVEHAQLVDPADRVRFAAGGVAASVQPIHLRSDAAQARKLWGSRAETGGYAWGSLAATGAVLAFGTDSPVEPFDPWPGIALAACRVDPDWPGGTAAFGPAEALSVERALRAACVGGPQSAGEVDRGRLTVGQRADLVVMAAAGLVEPVEPGGPLGTTRPSIVVMDGRVVFET